MPIWSKRDDLLVQVDADLAAHADGHRLAATHSFYAGFQMIDEVLCDQPRRFSAPTSRFDCAPFCLLLLLK